VGRQQATQGVFFSLLLLVKTCRFQFCSMCTTLVLVAHKTNENRAKKRIGTMDFCLICMCSF
jgi:hypothetical protein